MPFLFGNTICLALSILTIVSALVVTRERFPPKYCMRPSAELQQVHRLPRKDQSELKTVALALRPSRVYYAFFSIPFSQFKDITYASRVREVLYNVSIGTPVPGNRAGASPWIFCITGPGQVKWERDENPGGDLYYRYMSHNSPATVHFSRDAPFIFIFPRFWNYPSVPSASPSTCLTVVPHFNNYKQNGEDYISYQLWILLHEFIHHYTYDYSPEADREIFLVNDCLRLPASKAIGNPQNYIFYVASEFFDPLYL